MYLFIAVTTFIATIAMVVIRPRGMHEAVPAVLGAAVLLAADIVSWNDVLTVGHIIWNATASLIAVMIFTMTLDDIGLFHWMAIKLAKRSKGSPFRLFCAVFFLGSFITVLFNNDGSILILTPIVYKVVQDMGISRKTALPLLVTCGFVADTASVPLLISNLVNIVTTDFFHYDFPFYAGRMLFPGFVAILSSFLCLAAFYRTDLVGVVRTDRLPAESDIVKDWWLLRFGMVMLCLIVSGYLLGSRYHWPVSAVAALGSGVFLSVARLRQGIRVRSVLKRAPWGIVFFALGMYLVVFGLRNVGLTAMLGTALRWVMDKGIVAGTVFTGILSALIAAVMNNLPSTMTSALSIEAARIGPGHESWLAMANVIGNDIGPKLTPIGSLSTLLWLEMLRKRGVDISWRYYLRIGLIMTPPILLATLAALVMAVPR